VTAVGPTLLSLLSHWRRNPVQLVMLWLGLALATALWSGVQAINAEARSSYDAAAATLGQDQLARLVGRDGGPVPMAEYVALRRAGYLVSPVITGEIRDDAGRLRLIGVDVFTAPEASNAPQLGSGGVEAAAFLGEDGLLLMSETTAAGALPSDLPPIAILDSVPPAAAITDIATAARLLDRSDPDYLIVAPDQPGDLPPLSQRTTLRLEPPEASGDVARLTDSFHLNLTAFGLLSFGVGLFIVHAAIGLAFEQRRAVFRTLRAVGLPLRTLMAALAVEITVMALIAGTIGIALGYAIAAALMPGVAGDVARALWRVGARVTHFRSGLGSLRPRDHASRGRGGIGGRDDTNGALAAVWRPRNRAHGRKPPTARCGCRHSARWS
jgi:putative ABC transport system permease protein